MTILTARPISGPPVLKPPSALASDVRFELVQILAHGKHCVCDLDAVLNLLQSKVSYHLAALREVGLVSSEQCGKNSYCGKTSYYRLERERLYTLGGDLLQALLTPDPGLTRRIKSVC